MTEDKTGKRTKGDLAREAMEKWTPWEELKRRFPSDSVLYGALTEFMPKAIIAYEENRKHLSGLRDQIGEADNELKRLKTSITDADGKLGEAKSRLSQLDAAKASVQEEIKGLEAKSVTLDRDIVSKEESKQKAIADAETSEKQLKEFVDARDLLAPVLPLSDLNVIANVFKSIVKLDKDPKLIVETFGKYRPRRGGAAYPGRDRLP